MTATKSHNRLAPANIRFHAFRLMLLPFLPSPQRPCRVSPVVIGAMGGSGTRVLPQILGFAGFWMGAWVNPRTQDAMATRHFLQRNFARLASHQAEDDDLVAEFLRVIAAHRWGMPVPDGRWGWKNPRNMWIIPFLARVYPEMKFVHVVRDGRDMALSDNTNLLCKHGGFLLEDQDCESDREAAQLRLWTLGNRIAHEDGKRCLGSNYLALNYEKLCQAPQETLVRLFAFLEVDAGTEMIGAAKRLIRPSPKIGRWKASDSRLLQEPEEQTRQLLHLFGYDCSEEVGDSRTTVLLRRMG